MMELTNRLLTRVDGFCHVSQSNYESTCAACLRFIHDPTKSVVCAILNMRARDERKDRGLRDRTADAGRERRSESRKE